MERERERDREREHERGRERERGERILSGLCADSSKPDAWLDLTIF